MRAWIYAALQRDGAQRVALRLEIQIRPEWTSRGDAWWLAHALNADQLLDVIDAILGAGGPWPALHPLDPPFGDVEPSYGASMCRELEVMLAEGRSAYRINGTRDGLVRRVDATVTAAAAAAAAAAAGQTSTGSAADQIRDAWNELYSISPNPPAAYGAAIKAVESAGHSIIEPNNARATLGTMLRQLRDNPQRYELAIPGPDQSGDVEPLVKMIELLWTGQTSRHGAQTVTRAETQEESALAVHLAVTLMHWFSTGGVRRKP